MSGMLLLLLPVILILVWCGLTALLWKAWKRKRAEATAAPWRVDVAFAVLAAVWLSAGFWYSGGRKIYYDMEVNRLCAIDGGVKVYETVKLPPERFDKYGQINFYKPTQGESTLGPEFLFKRETTYYRQGNPDLFRMHTQIIRRSDDKLLGESVFYKRGGGDMPGPWHGSSFMCPELSVANDILRQIFNGVVQ